MAITQARKIKEILDEIDLLSEYEKALFFVRNPKSRVDDYERIDPEMEKKMRAFFAQERKNLEEIIENTQITIKKK